MSEAENKKDDEVTEVSNSTPKAAAQAKKKTASSKRLKKGPKSVEDIKA